MRTEAERFWVKVDVLGDCWLWAAGLDGHGYGQFRVGSRTDGTRRMVRAHRWAYEHLVGVIPDGLDLDHLCRTPRCVNPAHLEPVTNRENSRRGFASRGATARHGMKSMYDHHHCRCGLCTRAVADYERGRRARQKVAA